MKKALKIYISVDMEGMAGITSPSQERDEVPSFRRALHNQVRWIIEGIHASSRNDEIGEITISDSHGSGTNLSYDELCQMDERISLVSGSPRRQYMMSCLDEPTMLYSLPDIMPVREKISPIWITASTEELFPALRSTEPI